MRMIKTYEGMTMNCDVIATIQSVFMNIATGSISEMVDDSFDPDTLEFAVTAFTTLGDETMPDTSWKTGLFTMLAAITP